MSLVKCLNLLKLEAIQTKFWYLYGLLGIFICSFAKKEYFITPDMGIFSFFTMFALYIILILQSYKEEKNLNGTNLILTTSYTRENLIFYKYFRCLIYVASMTLINLFYVIFILNYTKVLFAIFLAKTILFSLTLISVMVPLDLQCNTGNSFAFKSCIFFIPYEIFCCELGAWINQLNIDSVTFLVLSIIISMGFVGLSIIVSKKIFLNKDL